MNQLRIAKDCHIYSVLNKTSVHMRKKRGAKKNEKKSDCDY